MLHLDNDAVAFKIMLLFHTELLNTIRTGTLDPELHKLLVDVFEMMTDNTQDIEGVNSIISHIVDLAPSIGLKLLSGRILVKKTLKFAAASERENVIQEVCQVHSAVRRHEFDAARWEVAVLDAAPVGVLGGLPAVLDDVGGNVLAEPAAAAASNPKRKLVKKLVDVRDTSLIGLSSLARVDVLSSLSPGTHIKVTSCGLSLG